MPRKRVSRLFDLKEDEHGRKYMEVYLDGIALLRLVLSNKGTAFSHEERVALRLGGLLPPQYNTLEQQIDRVYQGFVQASKRSSTSTSTCGTCRNGRRSSSTRCSRSISRRCCRSSTPRLLALQCSSSARSTRTRAAFRSLRSTSTAPTRPSNCYPMEDVRMIVATDSSAILGIGDQGYGGLAIPIGKMALYTVGGGVSPFHTMPVALDVGTDRMDLINDPNYLGVRQKRLRGDDYYKFFDQFVDAVWTRWPDAVIQWEDLSKTAAFTVLERYRDRGPSFNDDIQGTGAVALAGILAACHLRNESLKDEIFVIHGAGAGGIGVAWAIREGLVRAGLSRAEAKARVFVLDSRGLLLTDREMEKYKQDFAHDRATIRGWEFEGDAPDLVDTIRNAKATVLLGLSGRPDAFDEPVVRAMADNHKWPIIFPLSNPTSSAEAKPVDIFRWTDGQAIVATGSPFDPVRMGGRHPPYRAGEQRVHLSGPRVRRDPH